MAKFQALAQYRHQEAYEFLPFKFDRFDTDHTIVTNLVGEYVLLKNKDFDDFVNKKIASESDVHSTLRGKHLIFYPDERAPLDLLALKYRTQLSRLVNFTNLHVFVVTLRCDHSCAYCQVSRQSENKTMYDMTPQIADKALDFVFKSPNPAIKIEFQGGEPLLNFPLVQYVVCEAEKRNVSENRQLEFVIATTLSLLTDEILEFCKQHNISLSSSLDGPLDLHNKNRPKRGRDSHQLFEKGLKRARDVLGIDKVSALMTTTEASLTRVKEIIDEYIRLGFNSLFLRSLSPYGFAIKTKRYTAYDVDAWFAFFKKGLDYILYLNKIGIPLVEVYSALILKKIFTSNDPGFVDLMNPSGAGIEAIVFNYNGLVYPSDESRMLSEMGDEQFQLGNLLTQTYEELMFSDKLFDVLESSFALSVPMCSDCAFEPYCGAEPVFHYTIQHDIVGRKPESPFCQKNTAIFKHLIKLMEDDRSVKDIFRRWATQC